MESKACRLWDPATKRVLKGRDVKFLHKFQENEQESEHAALDDFIDVEIMENSCKDKLQNEIDKVKRENNDDNACNKDEDEGARVLPATKPGRGRPKIIRTGKVGRPTKRKHKVP